VVEAGFLEVADSSLEVVEDNFLEMVVDNSLEMVEDNFLEMAVDNSLEMVADSLEEAVDSFLEVAVDSSLEVVEDNLAKAVNLDEDNAQFCPKQVLRKQNQVDLDQLHVLRHSKHAILQN
jgi:hypothetical protein